MQNSRTAEYTTGQPHITAWLPIQARLPIMARLDSTARLSITVLFCLTPTSSIPRLAAQRHFFPFLEPNRKGNRKGDASRFTQSSQCNASSVSAAPALSDPGGRSGHLSVTSRSWPVGLRMPPLPLNQPLLGYTGLLTITDFGEVPGEVQKRRRVLVAWWQCRFFVIRGATTDTHRRFLEHRQAKNAVGGVAS